MSAALNLASNAIATKYSQLSNAILGNKSVYMQTGNSALTPTDRDETTFIQPSNGNLTPAWVAGAKIVYSLPKTATLIGKMWHEITLSAGVTQEPAQVPPTFTPAVGANSLTNLAAVAALGRPAAEYIENIGDLIFDQTILRYSTNPLQVYDMEAALARRMISENNVLIQATNAEVLGNLPPGGNTEQVRIDAFYNGVTLRTPLDFIYFTQCMDRHWMPEALALEGTLELVFRDRAQCIITRSGTNAELIAAGASFPAVTDVRLRYQQITLSAAEKMNRLQLYKSPQGSVNLFEDLEMQTQFQFTPTVGAGIAITQFVPLSNFRMDMKEIIFFVRRAVDPRVPAAGMGTFFPDLQGFRGSRMMSNVVTPNLLGGQLEGCLVPIISYRLQAAGKDLQNDEPELYVRAADRKFYHPNAEIANNIYHHAWAIYPEDVKNATGHTSASVLGNLNLVLNLQSLGATTTLQVDVFSYPYNLMQARAGSIAKALQ